MTQYDIDEKTLRQPHILNLHNTEYHIKTNASPIAQFTQVTQKSITEKITTLKSKIAELMPLEDSREKKTLSSMLWKFPWKELDLIQYSD